MEKYPHKEKPNIPYDVVIRPKEVVVTAKVDTEYFVEADCNVYDDGGKQYLKVVIEHEDFSEELVVEMLVRVGEDRESIEAMLNDDGIEIRIKRVGDGLESLDPVSVEDTLSPDILHDQSKNAFVLDVDLHAVDNPQIEINPRKEDGTGKDVIEVRVSVGGGKWAIQTFRFPVPIDTARIQKIMNNGQLEVVFPIKVDNRG